MLVQSYDKILNLLMTTHFALPSHEVLFVLGSFVGKWWKIGNWNYQYNYNVLSTDDLISDRVHLHNFSTSLPQIYQELQNNLYTYIHIHIPILFLDLFSISLDSVVSYVHVYFIYNIETIYIVSYIWNYTYIVSYICEVYIYICEV